MTNNWKVEMLSVESYRDTVGILLLSTNTQNEKKKSIDETFLTEISVFLLRVSLYSMKFSLVFCFPVVVIYVNPHY